MNYPYNSEWPSTDDFDELAIDSSYNSTKTRWRTRFTSAEDVKNTAKYFIVNLFAAHISFFFIVLVVSSVNVCAKLCAAAVNDLLVRFNSVASVGRENDVQVK